MGIIAVFLADDHEHCDRLFADAEHAVSRGNWDDAASNHHALTAAMERHFAMEEGVLFPAFESVSGIAAGGPTVVMRHEHAQMRGLFGHLDRALAERDADAYLGEAETLLILMQQHNAKEEQILYPMSDRVIAAPAELVERMRAEPI